MDISERIGGRLSVLLFEETCPGNATNEKKYTNAVAVMRSDSDKAKPVRCLTTKDSENWQGNDSRAGKKDSVHKVPTSSELGSLQLAQSRRKKKRKYTTCHDSNPKEFCLHYLSSRCLTICTVNCKYDVVRRIATRFGLKEVAEDSGWNLYWTDLSVSIERVKDMKRFQKVNHFPGMTEICRKDLLARNLNRMLKLFPKEYSFFPKTWCFPSDYGEAMAYTKLRRSRTFIIKPDTGCQGRGIYLTKNLKDIKPGERLVCQVYISKPFLIDGYKFDLRVYTLIASCDPLRIYVYNDGLVRFATSRYKEPTNHNATNVFMHLTNYAVNKHSRMYISDEEIGSKRKISTLNKWMRSKDLAVDEMWHKIDDIIVKTVLAAQPTLRHSYHACFPTHDRSYACFELLGFDILIDWKLKPYLLEVNHSPSFHTDTPLDKEIKESLLMDTFEIINLNLCDKKKIVDEDRRRVRERLLQGLSINETLMGMPKDKLGEDYTNAQLKWEDEHMGNFRRIYPCGGSQKYEAFFKQNNISLFQDTAASRAREEAARIHKEEIAIKTREGEGKRTCGKWSDSKLHPESPEVSKRAKANANAKNKPRSANGRISSSVTEAKKEAAISNNGLSSFEPELISETEERERVMGLAQRDFLVKSYGVLEQIYMAMRKNGTLRAVDEQKYGLYGKPGHTNHSSFADAASHPDKSSHRYRFAIP